MPKPYGRSVEAALYRRLYKTARWHRLRDAQLAAEPLCRFCLAIEDVTEATVCDHIEPHRGQLDLFYDPDNLQSLCAPCHDKLKARIERGQQAVVIGVDVPRKWPTDHRRTAGVTQRISKHRFLPSACASARARGDSACLRRKAASTALMRP